MTNSNGMTPIKRFFGLLKEEKSQVYAIYFYAILNGIITLTLPLGIQAILNFILGGRMVTSWVLLIIVVALGVIFGGFLQISQLQIMERLEQRLFSKSGLSLAYRLPRIKCETLQGDYAPEIVNRFFDTINLQKGLSKILIDFSTALFQVVFGMLLLSIYHPVFISFGLVLFGILAVIFYATGPKGMSTALKESSYKYKTAFWLEEVGRALNTFKLSGNTNLPILRADKLIQKYIEFRAKHFGVLIFQYKVMIGFKVLIVVSLLVAGSLLLMNDQISIGQFVAAEVIIILIINSVEKLIVSLDAVYDTLVATEKLGQVMDLEMEHHDPADKVVHSRPEGLKLQVNELKFQLHGSMEPILKGVSLTVQPGKKIAVTGKSGSGKSSLLSLIAGLYEDYEGEILINDLSLEYINLEKYRSMIGGFIDWQQIFEGTLRENILVGRKEIDPDQLDYILDLVGLGEFVYKHPLGLELLLHPEARGAPKYLAHSILLARGLVGSPKVLLMEDVLTHIESELKSRIVSHILEGPWTLLLISEDQDILSRADEVIWLDSGVLKFRGTYQDYLKLNK